ncbi:hypothetical protein E8E14_012705 [Neopestalotiopsis sp. 37M]|nr:hypothetical protein E8E14_012705 [Neopestalotiopsis sp. 37M]
MTCFKSLVRLSLVSTAFASPQYFGGGMPVHFNCPIVDSRDNIVGDPWQIGTCLHPGQQFTNSKAHTTGTTWTFGGELGFSAGDLIAAGGGFSGEVSETVEDTFEESATQLVKGHTEAKSACGFPSNLDWDAGDYELKIPRKDDSGNGFWTPEVCTCANFPHDDGHPERMCIEDCVPH